MNRLVLLCLGAIVLALISCTDKDKLPKGVLSQNKMESVLWDMLQAERYKTTFIKDSSIIKNETFKLYAEVFAIHQITKDQFIKSYKFYLSRPDLARDMFDSLAVKANRRREDMYKDNKPQPPAAAQPKGAQPQTQPTKPQTVQPPTDKPMIIPQPVTPQGVNPRLRHLPLRRIKKDSLLKLPS